VEIIERYVGNTTRHPPGTRQSYCSTNYILLGFALANHYHKQGDTWSWEAYDQKSVIPVSIWFRRSITTAVGIWGLSHNTPVFG
jgi:hypothetical protein